MQKRQENNLGITLIALVITIVVMLILAAVVIKLSVGDNGVIIRAKDSASKYNQAQDYEIGVADDISKEYDSIISGNWAGGGSGSNPGGNTGTNPGGNTTTPGGDNPNPPSGGDSNLSSDEKNKLEDNGIKELGKDEITNGNLKDNDNIKAVIEGEVPIPTGADYVEGTKDTGVVVAFGDSEFVWVPVPEISEMAKLQTDSTENYQGVLYNFSGTTATEMTSYGIGTKEPREPDVVPSANVGIEGLSIINDILGTSYTAASQFLMDLQGDFNSMVESVLKYKGFFIGRYETSLDEDKKAKSKKGVLPATAAESSANKWYGLYAYEKKMAEDNGLTSVKSHMIWGSQYDAMLRWALIGADNGKVTTIGRAAHDLTSVYETGKETKLNTKDIINNIYDLEGNGCEWTAEVDGYRLVRGGYFRLGRAPSFRSDRNPCSTDGELTSRQTLYIK